MRNEPIFLVVDLFCGFGGTTTGYAEAEINGNKLAKVIACVNHDPKAIKSHWLNHADVKHFEEDIRTLDLTELIKIVQYWRNVYPNAYLILWASLECTNFSRAKGGKAKDADSRTLAEHLFRYENALQPDYIKIENVVEFREWSPLDENGKPIKERAGECFDEWRAEMCSYGYYDEWRELNSADFGGHTSRNRLFGCFAKNGLPISWPAPTHAKKSKLTMFETREKWKAVRELIDHNNLGKSVFGRKKPLADRTVYGLIKGIKKHIVNSNDAFLFNYYGNSYCTSLNDPSGTIRTKQSMFYVKAFIHNPAWGQGSCTSIENPLPTIVARQDKAPLRLLIATNKPTTLVEENYSEAYKELRAVMNEHGITDILYRGLTISELLTIQGFPSNYKMVGSKANQQKFIGNSVNPKVPKAWAENLANQLSTTIKAA